MSLHRCAARAKRSIAGLPLLAAAWATAPHTALAAPEGVGDPTRPPAALAPSAAPALPRLPLAPVRVTPVAPPLPAMVLQGIQAAPGRGASALISGRIVQVGDTAFGRRVVAIDADAVTLQAAGAARGTERLSLYTAAKLPAGSLRDADGQPRPASYVPAGESGAPTPGTPAVPRTAMAAAPAIPHTDPSPLPWPTTESTHAAHHAAHPAAAEPTAPRPRIALMVARNPVAPTSSARLQP